MLLRKSLLVPLAIAVAVLIARCPFTSAQIDDTGPYGYCVVRRWRTDSQGWPKVTEVYVQSGQAVMCYEENLLEWGEICAQKLGVQRGRWEMLDWSPKQCRFKMTWDTDQVEAVMECVNELLGCFQEAGESVPSCVQAKRDDDTGIYVTLARDRYHDRRTDNWRKMNPDTLYELERSQRESAKKDARAKAMREHREKEAIEKEAKDMKAKVEGEGIKVFGKLKWDD